jgi:hypothetical protein
VAIRCVRLFVFIDHVLCDGERLEMLSKPPDAKVRNRIARPFAFSLFFCILGLIDLFADYLQFEQAQKTNFFWMLFAAAVFFAVIGLIELAVRWWRHRSTYAKVKSRFVALQQRIATLLEIRDEIRDCESAILLQVQIRTKPKIVAIRSEEGVVKAIINIGKNENLKIGTPLLVCRTDNYTPDGLRVEQPIGLLKISYVQARNNLSHADVVNTFGQAFWPKAQKQLRKECSIKPPQNFIVPYVLPQFGQLSLSEVSTIRRSLDLVIKQLTGVDQPVTEQEDSE